MSSESSTCPEDRNSTDCLLRAVIQTLKNNHDQESAEFEWDPLNLTFTIILGFIAALIAVPALYHAVYNTEKRRKVNHRAIGPWSNIKERTWVKSVMAFQYTAKTPVYRMDAFRDWTGKEYIPLDRSPTVKPGVPSAGWITFSQKTGLDAWISPHTLKDEGNFRSVNVEHLPDDIVAAPAYAEVGVVLVAAAAAGIRHSNLDKKFENAFVAGDSFQLDFLRHPLLGLIGSFSHYDTPTRDEIETPTREKLEAARQHALGLVWLRPGVTAVPTLTDMTLGSDYSMERIRRLYEEKPPIVSGFSRWNSYGFFFMKFDLIQPHIIQIHHLFQAVTPKYIPAFFPRQSTGLSGDYSLDTLALIGKYWSEANVTKFAEAPILHWPKIEVGSKGEREDHPLPSWRRFEWKEKVELPEGLQQNLKTATNFLRQVHVQTGNWSSEKWRDAEFQVELAHILTSTTDERPHVCGLPVVLHMCMKLLNKPSDIKKWFFGSDLETKALLRSLVFEQLRHVDAWLATEARANYFISLLFLTWLLLLATKDKFEIHPKAEEIDTTEKPPPSSDPEGKTDRDSTKKPQLSNSKPYQRSDRGTTEKPQLSKSNPSQRPGRDTIYGRHSSMILGLRELLEPAEPVNMANDILEDGLLTDVSTNSVLSPLLSSSQHFERNAVAKRLQVIAAYHSDKETPEETPNLHGMMENFKEHFQERRELEDVIIYRFLLLVLLYETAADNSTALESGLWDRIIPII